MVTLDALNPSLPSTVAEVDTLSQIFSSLGGAENRKVLMDAEKFPTVYLVYDVLEIVLCNQRDMSSATPPETLSKSFNSKLADNLIER